VRQRQEIQEMSRRVTDADEAAAREAAAFYPVSLAPQHTSCTWRLSHSQFAARAGPALIDRNCASAVSLRLWLVAGSCALVCE
jgi:hypothetical protein